MQTRNVQQLLNKAEVRKSISCAHCELDVLNTLPEDVRGMKADAKGFSTLPLEVRSGAEPSVTAAVSLLAFLPEPLSVGVCPLAADSTLP